jgi:type I restriction enzyme, S subunit
MTSEWLFTTLGNVVELKRGYDLPKRLRLPGKVPVISSAGTSGSHSESKVVGPGVITGRYGTIGDVFFSNDDFWPLNTTLYVRDFKDNDPKFIYYFLQTLNYDEYSDKAAVPGVNRNHLHLAKVKVPVELKEQKAIAHILGSLDDKIELNRQMNATLEAMAQTLFKSWFVDFDPVIDNALAAGNPIPDEFQDRATQRQALGNKRKPLPADIRHQFPDSFELTNELGWIPKGWNAVESSEMFEVRDGTHDSPKQSETGKYLITSRHITGHTIDFSKSYLISDADFELVNKRSKVDSYDILLTMIGTVGVPFLVMEEEINFAIKNIGLFKTGIDKALSAFFYLFLNTSFMKQFLESRMAGTTQKYLTLGILRTLPVLKAPPKLMSSFGDEVLPVFNKIHSNNKNNHELIALRDTLLPKLLSGEVRVPDAETMVEDVR